MSEIRFTIKVFAIHPAYDSQRNEYVCVEFGFRPPKVPTMVPTSVPREVADIIQASQEMVKVVVPPQFQAQTRKYANRLVLFLATDEWERLQQKYTAGDEFEVTIKQDGSLNVKRT